MGEQGTSGPSHSLGVKKGEEIARDEGKEGGRQETGSSHADRPAGTKTARDATAINPEERESNTEGKTMPPA